MKTIILNGSPRKKWNTAKVLQSAQHGAESVGSETEYIDLYDLSFTGCRSCLACKRKGMDRCRCYWRDDLSPVIDRIFKADALIVGSPIYFGDITSQLQAVLERLRFCALSYDDYSSYFPGKVDVGVIFTMNMPRPGYDEMYKEKLEERMSGLSILNGKMKFLPCCNTLQVEDYSKFNMASFDEAVKKESRRVQFPKDLDLAFQFGAKLGQAG